MSSLESSTSWEKHCLADSGICFSETKSLAHCMIALLCIYLYIYIYIFIYQCVYKQDPFELSKQCNHYVSANSCWVICNNTLSFLCWAGHKSCVKAYFKSLKWKKNKLEYLQGHLNEKACLARLWQCTLSSQPFICQQCTSHMLDMEDSQKGHLAALWPSWRNHLCWHVYTHQSGKVCANKVRYVECAVLPCPVDSSQEDACDAHAHHWWACSVEMVHLFHIDITSEGPLRREGRGSIKYRPAFLWPETVSETMKVPPDKHTHTTVANRVQVNLTKKEKKKESMDEVNRV